MKIKVTIDEILYYLFFGIMFTAKGIGMDSGQKIFQCCMLVSLLCIFLKICITKYSIKEWIFVSSLLALGFMIWKSSNEIAAIWAVLIIVGMKNIPIGRLMKICMGIWSISFLVTFLMGIIHIRDGVVVVHEKLGLGPVIRWSLGYTHPNVLHISYFILVVLLVYVFRWHGRNLWKASAGLMAGNCLIFLYSVSYTGILIVTGYILLVLSFEYLKKMKFFEPIIWSIMCAFLIAFPIVAPLWMNTHNHKLFMFFNELFSYRFELVYNIFSEYPISLFGTETIFSGKGHLTLDSSFAYLLMYYGVVGFSIFAVFLVYLVFYYAKINRKYELAIILVTITAGITEQFLFNLSFKNLLFFFMGEVLFTHILKDTDKKNIWNFKCSVFSIQKCINLPQGSCMNLTFRQIGINTKKVIFSGILFALESVYVDRWLTDYRGEDKVYLDMDNLPDDFNSLVIGYRGPDSEMFEFSGNIVILEKVRGTVGGMILGAVSGITLATIFYCLKRRDKGGIA